MSDPADQPPTQVLAMRRRNEAAAGLLNMALEDEDEECLQALEQKPGDVIGRYELMAKLGEGGFGIVWKAAQREPIQREVALKIIRPGMDTRTVIARFRAEQQALQRMEHPNIAAVLDAGATEQGRPFFVMELVRGRAITHYCEEQGLSLRQRLELFIDVCRAVQHAHQKAILHRDLKPSNILVAEVDGKPVPKVIDFGIAKALTGDVDGLGTLAYTAHGMVLGTPQYMAPEQAMMGGEDMDIRVDVYSLGAILYKLLTGTPPMVMELNSRTSVDQLLKRIHDEEADRPSTRVRQRMVQHEGSPQKASQLKGDLDWIVLKALEKSPERRYATANALAEDLLRYLHDEPVSAGPPDTWYRVQKLVRRNRVAFITGGVIMLSLIAVALISTLSFLRESDARQKADYSRRLAETSQRKAANEAVKAEGVVKFLTRLLDQAGKQVDKGKNPEALRLALDQSVHDLDALTDQPELEARLCAQLAEVYATMGETGRVMPLHYRQLARFQTLFGASDPRTLDVHLICAKDESNQGDKLKALAMCEDIIRSWESSGRKGSGGWFDACRQRATQLGQVGRKKEAVDQMQQLLGYRSGRGQMAEEDTSFLRVYAQLLTNAGEFKAAAEVLQRKLAQVPAGQSKTLAARATILLALARLEARQNHYAEAIQCFEEMLPIEIKLSGDANSHLIDPLVEVSRLYAKTHRLPDAFRATDQALRIARVTGVEEKLPHALRASAEIREEGDHLDEAITFRRECLEVQRKVKPAGGLWVYEEGEVARLLSKAGRHDEAEQRVHDLWQHTQSVAEVWQDDDLVIDLCNVLIGVCRQWQQAKGSLAHQADIDLWRAKISELEAKKKSTPRT